MSSSQRKYFSGSSLDNALMQAARYHGLAPEEVAYRKIEKRHGFLRTRKAVVIEVDPEAPRIRTGSAVESSAKPTTGAPTSAATNEPAPVSPPIEGFEERTEQSAERPVEAQPEPGTDASTERQPVTAADERADDAVLDEIAPTEDATASGPDADTGGQEASEADLLEAAARGLQDILDFAMLDLETDIHPGESELEVELTGADRQRLIEDRGNLLLSIQHLLPRLIRGRAGRSTPCHVDSGGFHAEREIELRRLAEEAAAEVRQRHQPRTLPPMNPAERRIIHVTLAEDNDLSTESQGKGFFKRVTISPAMRRPRGFDRYNR